MRMYPELEVWLRRPRSHQLLERSESSIPSFCVLSCGRLGALRATLVGLWRPSSARALRLFYPSIRYILSLISHNCALASQG
jgi:hypothetical protein